MPTGVYERSEAYRQKLREAMFRRENPGKNPTEETRRKIGLAAKGRIVSKETRKKRSESLKGKPSPKKGIKLSKEHKEKISKALAKEKHYNWKGGLCKKSYISERNTRTYRLWRKYIIEEQNGLCQWCGVKAKRMEIDHIIPASFNKILFLERKNVRVLCHECHKNTPSYGGRIVSLKKIRGKLISHFRKINKCQIMTQSYVS